MITPVTAKAARAVSPSSSSTSSTSSTSPGDGAGGEISFFFRSARTPDPPPATAPIASLRLARLSLVSVRARRRRTTPPYGGGERCIRYRRPGHRKDDSASKRDATPPVGAGTVFRAPWRVRASFMRGTARPARRHELRVASPRAARESRTATARARVRRDRQRGRAHFGRRAPFCKQLQSVSRAAARSQFSAFAEAATSATSGGTPQHVDAARAFSPRKRRVEDVPQQRAVAPSRRRRPPRKRRRGRGDRRPRPAASVFGI